MEKITRVGDRTHGICSHPSHVTPITVGGTVITGAEKCYCNGRKISRIGDRVQTDCGHTGYIVTGSAKSISENKKVSKVGDRVDGVYKATIISGSLNSYSS